MKLRKYIRRIITNRYIYIPILWRKDTDIPFGKIGIREWVGIHSIAMWYIEDRHKSVKEYFNVVKTLKDNLQNHYSSEEKKILFIVEYYITGRFEKITRALCKKGYKITLLYATKLVPNTDDLEKLKRYYETVRAYDSVTQLMFYIIESRIPIAHFFVSWNNFTTLLLLLQIKGIMPRIVSEKYDIFNGMYVPEIANKRYCRAEKYFMEHSDGVCAREYALEYCIKELGFRLSRENLVFLDYADEMQLYEKEENDELSLCYVGGIATEEEYPDASYACFLELATKCENNKCHLHVYPSTWDEKRFAKYIEFDGDSQYFHFHYPVGYDQLYKEISQYDYGIHPVKNTYLDDNIDGYMTKNKTIYASTNKYFDYISARIPIIGISPVRITEEIEKHGGILRWTIDDYDFDELRKRKKELREEIIRSRVYWLMDNRISELTDYYEMILNDL